MLLIVHLCSLRVRMIMITCSYQSLTATYDQGLNNNSIDNMVKRCDQLIVGLEQCALISKHEVMAVYSNGRVTVKTETYINRLLRFLS